ncbi:MAG TPA: hypothetical protein VJI69_01315 [Bacteroidia bacterium]|nr:hypothetical protein [Bacteroidia bacterium]
MIKELSLVTEPNVAFTEDLLKEFVTQFTLQVFGKTGGSHTALLI